MCVHLQYGFDSLKDLVVNIDVWNVKIKTRIILRILLEYSI